MKARKVFLAIVAAMALLAWQLLQPVFLVQGGGRTLLALPVSRPQAFTVRFIHSVQKTPVEEDLVADAEARGGAGEFRLLRTRFQSFGVGLPFMESEGEFHEEGDYFVFDHMDRHFPALSLRTGVGTQLTLRAAGRTLRFYEMFPPGERIDLSIAPAYEALSGL